MLRANQLDADRACVLVVDLQEKLLPLVEGHERILLAVRKLLAGARIFELPVLVTEQYAKGLGPTHDSLAPAFAACRASVLEKPTFSACDTSAIREAFRKLDRPQVILCGIEAHVCVLQTALDLRVMDYDVFVCADAVGSRAPMDFDVALDRLRQEGVFVTTVETVLFELCGRCDAPRFKPMLEIIKANDGSNNGRS